MRAPPHRSNEDWVRDLTHHGSPQQRQAFEELARLLYRVAWHLLARTGMQELAEDCVQEALMTVLTNLPRFHGESRFTTWAIGILHRKCWEITRKHRRETATDFNLPYGGETLPLLEALEDLETPDPELTAARRELVQVVEEIIRQRLTLRQRIALVNIALLDHGVQDVAAKLNTSRNNVYKILHDARKRLRKELENRGYAWEDVQRLLS